MIKFFRHIRKKLLSENKFSKYFIYALGEILLVVIGILIALQINNWNQQEQTKEKELKYLSLIKKEMEGNLQSIQLEKGFLLEFLGSLSQLLDVYAKPDTTITNKELSEILVPILSRDMDFYFKTGTLNEVIATGNLKNITNDSIRTILSSISGNLERLRAQETRVNTYISKGSSFLEKHGSVKQIVFDIGINKEYGIPDSPEEISNLSLLKSDEFENVMVYCSLTGGSLNKEYYTVFEDEIHTLIALINKELER